MGHFHTFQIKWASELHQKKLESQSSHGDSGSVWQSLNTIWAASGEIGTTNGLNPGQFRCEQSNSWIRVITQTH